MADDMEAISNRVDELEQWRIAIDKRNVHSDDLIVDFHKLEVVVLGNGKDGMAIKIDRIERDLRRVLWGISVLALASLTALLGIGVSLLTGVLTIIHK